MFQKWQDGKEKELKGNKWKRTLELLQYFLSQGPLCRAPIEVISRSSDFSSLGFAIEWRRTGDLNFESSTDDSKPRRESAGVGAFWWREWNLQKSFGLCVSLHNVYMYTHIDIRIYQYTKNLQSPPAVEVVWWLWNLIGWLVH